MKKIFTKFKDFLKTYCPVPALCLYIFAALSLIIHLLCIAFEGFADFFNVRIAGGVRFVLAKVTSILPVSLAEWALCFVPLIILAIIVYVSYHTKREHFDLLTRFFCCAFAALSVFYSLFVFTLGTGYHGSGLSDKLGLETKELTSDELIEITKWYIGKTNECAEKVSFIDSSSSVMPYDFGTLNDKLNDAYESAAEKFDFIMGYSSRIKPVAVSKILSKMGLLGMYSYYTGETNVNIDYPDYVTVYTCAHEMSHQRGISKEDEANFMAFLVCLESDDPYINYCGYLNIVEYLRDPLYLSLKKENRTSKYFSTIALLDARAKNDIGVSDQKTVNNSGTVMNIANKVNDTFIKTQGDERGSDSYGMVIELAAAYYFDLKANDAA